MLVRIIVRIGALRRFHKLKQETADLPVEVVWDRRRGERREPAHPPTEERRTRERRRTPPFTWDAADFVVTQAPPQADDEDA